MTHPTNPSRRKFSASHFLATLRERRFCHSICFTHAFVRFHEPNPIKFSPYVSFKPNLTMHPKTQITLHVRGALFAALTLLPAINAQPTPPATGNQTDTIVMEAFVTTGSNIKRLDQENTLPVTVFNMSQLETRDSATPMDLLIGIPEITNIPQNEASLGA